MKLKNSYSIFSFFMLVILFMFINSCLSGENEPRTVTTEMVQNPVSASGNNSTDNLPKLEFEKTKYDFGLVIQGERVTYSFKYKNTGNSDLIISGATASCGCTVPKFDSKPIKPGKSGEIEVVFNSDNREGNQHKIIKVVSNSQPNLVELTILANVIVPK